MAAVGLVLCSQTLVLHSYQGISDPYPSIQNTCRLCGQNLLIKGTLQATRRIFDKPKASKEKKLCDRFLATGLVLTDAPGVKSGRICAKCYRLFLRIEESVSVLKKWQSEHQTSNKRKRELEPSPSETDRAAKKTSSEPEPRTYETDKGAKKKCPPYKKVPPRSSLVEVVITYPNQLDPKLKKRVEKVSSEFSGMVENLAKGKLTTFVRLALTNETMCQEIRTQMTQKIEAEVKAYARPLNYLTSAEPCILSSTSLENMKCFSYQALDDELSRKTPWLYTTINTATGGSTIHNCVAASVALRGRNPRLSALAYVINSTLTQGGVKPIFKRLSKMGITTTHSNVLNKQKEMKAAGYNINIKCWREDCELFFQHSVSGEVCPRPPPTAKPTEETGREEEEEEDRSPVEDEFEIELDWGPLEEEGEGDEEEWSPLSEETEREADRGSTVQGERREEKDRGSLLGETERDEARGSTVQEESEGKEEDRGSLLGETEREEEGHASSARQGNDRQEEDSDSTVDSESEHFGLNLTCESD
ncbi:uncharacterized protein LOC129831631 isoform X1 [Salvelinus fontinalis]|uniref:uncharacterized protein LOC129831631 isoform X1 n=2 Tax=Salvelinus fontinalis TaxID=8038 RepID=UPI0024865F68|nr:uncharacterized protein LOC129831631 isoform X1 [Salvelinus fontinalis]